MARVATLEAVITADTKGLTGGLTEAQASLAKTAGSMKNTGTSLTELASGLSLAKQGFAMVSGAVHAVIDPTVEYAAQVRNLGRNIGATAEESSKLIQAADDMMVSVSSLEAGLEAAIRKGVKPTIEGLGELADQYNAIQDPIAKTKFLMDNFGRSGADLAPLMEQGAAGIKELGDAAELAGLVMSQEGVDSMRKYELAVDQAQDSIMALKMSLSKELVPAITGYITTINDNLTVQQRYNRALEEGMLTKDEIRAIAVYDIRNAQDEAKAVLEAAEARREYSNTLVAVAHGYDGLTGSQNKATEGVHDAGRSAQASTDRWQGMADALGVAGEASDRFAYQQQKAADAAQLLAAGLAGRLGDAQDDYRQSLSETTPEIARLTAEIEKYRAEQGRTFTFTQDATTSANEFENATLKAALAVKELAEFTGDDALELSNLKVKADHAQESVVKLGEGLGFSKDFTIDHTKALAEDNAKLDEAVKAQDAAAAAIKRATAEFILQQAAAALGAEGALEFAHATGLISDADYTVTKSVQELTAAFDANHDGVITANEGLAAYQVGLKQIYDGTVNATSATDDLITKTDTIPAELVPATEAFNATAKAADGVTTSMSLIPPSVHVDTVSAIGSLEDASGAADYFTTRLDRIPREVRVSIITDNYQNYHGYQIPGAGGGQGDHAAGTDMFVPPGFPHDSYMIGVQSGEHVTVVPAGGSGTGSGGGTGSTYNFHFNNAQPVTVPNALQVARAVSGGLY